MPSYPISWARRNASSTPAGNTDEVDRPTGMRRCGCCSLRGSPAESRRESFSRAERFALLGRVYGLPAPSRVASVGRRSRRRVTAAPRNGQAWSVCNSPPPRLLPMPVRDLTTEDFLAYKTVSAGAFSGFFDPSAPGAPQGFSPAETALGIDAATLPGGLEGVIAAGARIRHDRLALGGGTARCGGIAGLAVHPAHRGDGLFGTLLTEVLARCRDERMALS